MRRLVPFCLALVMYVPVLSAQGSTSGAAAADGGASRVIVLGTANPLISATRSGVSIGVVVRGALYIFDAGPGVERRMLEGAERKLLQADRVGAVFLTHLHPDHTLGMSALLYHHLRGSLSVFGPPGTARMMEHIRAAFPLGTGQTAPAQVTEIGVGEVYRDSNVTVSAFQVDHRLVFAAGYRITTPDRVIVLSGDTRPVDAVATACNGCDILFHEVVGGEGWVGTGGVPMGGHTSATELGEIARKANPKLLVLYHQGYRGESDADLIGRISAGFKGRILSARDLDVY